MNFAAFGLHHRRAAILFTAILAVAGALAYGKLPKAIFPNMAYSSIEVTVNRGDTPAKQMDLQFSRPLQAAFAVVPGIRKVQATSSQGSVDIVANFDEHTSANRDLQYITQAIAALSGSLPVDAQIGAKIVALNYEPVVSYALRAPNVSRTVLAEELQRQSLAIFTGIPGLARVLVVGARPREYAVDIDPLKLAARSVSIADVESAIAGSTTVTAVGHGSARYQRVVAQVNPGVHGVRALSAISVASRAGEPVRLADLAHIHLAVAPRSGDATSMGKRSEE
ncbi:MAG: efflux RND transporter permease subunit, partial [Vulcanimicrobiaceae bacterium]